MSASTSPIAIPPDLREPPPGWRWLKLNEVARLESGHTPSRLRPDWWGGDVSWLSLTEIRALDGRWVESTQLRTNEQGIANSAARILPRGTVCLSRTASVGFVAIMAHPMATSQDFANWVCGEDVDPEYLMYALLYSRSKLREMATGATHKTIYMPTLEAFHLCAPIVDDQRRIAARLKAQLAEAESARQAAQEQLKDIALLRSRVLQTAFDELANIPMRPLGDWVISYRNGFGRRPGTDETGPIVLRIADVSSGTIDLSNPRRGSVSPKEAETYRLEPNDLLFVRVNGARHIVGRCCVVDTDIPSDTIFNDHLIRVCLKPGINPEFARFCASSLAARALIEEAASTSAGQLTINQQVIASINVPDLLVTEQCRFVLQMESQFTEIEALESANKEILNKLELLPQRLLAQAFEKEED